MCCTFLCAHWRLPASPSLPEAAQASTLRRAPRQHRAPRSTLRWELTHLQRGSGLTEVGPPHGLHSCGWARDILPWFPCTPRPCWDWTGFECPAQPSFAMPARPQNPRHRPRRPLAPLLGCAHGVWRSVGPGCKGSALGCRSQGRPRAPSWPAPAQPPLGPLPRGLQSKARSPASCLWSEQSAWAALPRF